MLLYQFSKINSTKKVLTENNYANSTVFCCVQTLSFLVLEKDAQ